MFAANQNKGFAMTFDNGITISVQWGTGNYCSAQNLSQPYGSEAQKTRHESATAEIAIWDKSDKDFYFEPGRTCEGWQSAEKVAEWIARAAKAESIKTL